jgi:hypothetical protein
MRVNLFAVMLIFGGKINMKWVDFVNCVYSELKDGSRLFDFVQSFGREQQLTRQVALGLRKFFAESYDLPVNSESLSYHVLYRQGDTHTDKLAWTQSQKDKWISFHGVRFVPDILIRRRLDDPYDILPIEVKLIKDTGSGQGIATAIGQSLIYGARYLQSIVFVGIIQSSGRGKYHIDIRRQRSEEILYKKLQDIGIRMILRELGE